MGLLKTCTSLHLNFASSHFLGIQKFFNIVNTMLNKTLVIASYFFSFNEFQKISWGGTAPPPYTSASVLWWKNYNSGFLPLFADTTLSMPTVLSNPHVTVWPPQRAAARRWEVAALQQSVQSELPSQADAADHQGPRPGPQHWTWIRTHHKRAPAGQGCCSRYV